MTYSIISIMRQELGLVVIALLVLFFDLVVNEKNKQKVFLIALALFGLHTLAGFFPFEGEICLVECTQPNRCIF